MLQDKIVIRSSPFLFLKRLVLIEFFFALLPFFIGFIVSLFVGDLTETYQILPFANSISFTLFLVILGTSVQILIIAVAFMSWYLPVYIVDREQIIRQRGSFFGDIKLIDTA